MLCFAFDMVFLFTFSHFFCLIHSHTYRCVNTHIASSTLFDLVLNFRPPCSLSLWVQCQCRSFLSETPRDHVMHCRLCTPYTNAEYTQSPEITYKREEVSLLVYSKFSRSIKGEKRESTHESGLKCCFSVQWPVFSWKHSPSMSLRASRVDKSYFIRPTSSHYPVSQTPTRNRHAHIKTLMHIHAHKSLHR